MTLAIDPRHPKLQSQNQEQHISVLKFPVLQLRLKLLLAIFFGRHHQAFLASISQQIRKNMSYTTYSGENVVCDNVVVYLYLLIIELKVHTSRSRKMQR